MMIHAYQEIYLNNAQSALGDAFDYAINTCGINGNDFVKLFLVSSICKRMENGEPDYLTGKSGIEIARDIIKETKTKNSTLSLRSILEDPKNIGLDGLLHIINGIPAENTAAFLKYFLLRIWQKCIIRSMKQISQNLLILPIQK